MKILYVEDDPRDADLTVRRLRKASPHLQMETVSTIREAHDRLERLALEPLDLVLTDMHLHDGSGLSLLTHIRESALPVAVVVITGMGDEETAVAALKARADDYVVKRKDYLDRLPLTLESALNHYRADAVRRARPLNVLYAECESGDIEETRRHLAIHANHIHLAIVSTAMEALFALQQQEGGARYDVLLLGPCLSEPNALDVLKELRLIYKLDTPVVVVCSQADEEFARRALKLGATSYVVKNPGYLHRLPWELEEAHFRAESLRHEAELQESQQRYKLATTATGVGVWDWDLETNELHIDPVLKFLLGYEGHEIRNHLDDWGRFVHPEDAALIRERAEAHIAGETPLFEVEHRMLHKDGSVRWFLCRGNAVRDDGGNAVSMVGTDTDITERKLAAEALRESEAINLAMLKAMPDLLFLHSRDGVYLSYHAKHPQDLYLPPECFLGKSVHEVLPAHLADAFERSVDEALRSNEPVRHEYSLSINGEDRYFEWQMVMCDDKVLTVVRNITERKRTERELQRLTAHLLNLQDTERRRIALELHDVTAQNLFAINMNLSRLRRGRLEQSEAEEIIAESRKLGHQSLQEIRTLSYLLHPPMLDQSGLVDALRWYVNGFIKRSGINVELRTIQEIGRLPSEVETALFRIVQESLTNINRHSGSSSADIRLEKEKDQVILQIRDHGRGMPKTALTEAGGTGPPGVGISGMRERLRQLGGMLEIESSDCGVVLTAKVPITNGVNDD